MISYLYMFLFKGNHPKMAQHFRLVNYYHVPRYMDLQTNLYYGFAAFATGVAGCEVAVCRNR